MAKWLAAAGLLISIAEHPISQLSMQVIRLQSCKNAFSNNRLPLLSRMVCVFFECKCSAKHISETATGYPQHNICDWTIVYIKPILFSRHKFPTKLTVPEGLAFFCSRYFSNPGPFLVFHRSHFDHIVSTFLIIE